MLETLLDGIKNRQLAGNPLVNMSHI